MDRQAASTALAKAIAFVNCGKPEKAADWLGELIAQFEAEGVVLLPRHLSDAPVPEAQVEYDLSDFSRRLGSQLL